MRGCRRILSTREQVQGNRWLGPRLLHPRLWPFRRRGLAIGVAQGMPFGLLIPVTQIPYAAGMAVLLRANPPAALGSAWVTDPNVEFVLREV